ncbi:MAG: hypothetical protein H6656_00620 [Ardenticatenaceae bacterium]|nr:hypothetical protein [Anaerolineales bacterium]MCB9005887.1 hypothetical protein [Ardenticatenaceae bacterium]
MLKPAYKLTYGRSAGSSSGLTGAVSNVTGGVLGGGSQIIDTTDEPQASTVVELTVRLDKDAPADSFTLVMGQVGSFRPDKDGELTIELGYDSDDVLTQVMTGDIISVEPGLTTSRVIGHSAALKLLRSFSNKTYENKTAAQIIRDLADQSGVSVAKADNGITFPAYVVDGRRNHYQHIRHLADLSGLDLYINAEGKLVMEKFSNGNTIHTLEYGKHVIELESLQSDLLAGKVEAFGESPGGGRAEGAWAWLTKDFSGNKGTAGSGEPTLLLERPVLRTAAAAKTAAQAASTRLQQRTIRGRLLIQGRPQIKLGDAIRLRGVPEEPLNGEFQVRSLIHHISKTGGFTTTINFQGKGN